MLSYRWYARPMCHMCWMFLSRFRSFPILNYMTARWSYRWKLTAKLDWFVRWHLVHLFVAILLNSAILFACKKHGAIIILLFIYGFLNLRLFIDNRVWWDNIESACKQTLLLFDFDLISFYLLLVCWVIETAIFALLRARCSNSLWADRSFVTLSRLNICSALIILFRRIQWLILTTCATLVHNAYRDWLTMTTLALALAWLSSPALVTFVCLRCQAIMVLWKRPLCLFRLQ